MYDILQQLSVVRVRVCVLRYSSAVGMAAAMGRLCGVQKSRVPPQCRTRTRDYASSLDSEGARATSSRARVCGPPCRLLVWHGTGATVGGPGPRSSCPHSASSQLPPHDRYAILLDNDAAATAAAVTRHHRRTPSSTTLCFLINIYMYYNRYLYDRGMFARIGRYSRPFAVHNMGHILAHITDYNNIMKESSHW